MFGLFKTDRDSARYAEGYEAGKGGKPFNPGPWNASAKVAYRRGYEDGRDEKD